MATLNARNIVIISKPPERDYIYKDVKIKSNIFRIFEDGAVWDMNNSKWRKPDIDKNGYRILSLGNYTTKLHRLILTVFQRSPTRCEQGRHLDGDPSNNDNSNLCWGTSKQNWIDRKLHGREGAEWRRLLSSEDALKVFNDPRPDNDIAKEYKIQRICVALIKEKLTYKDIHNEPMQV
jgi:hypothetical protein